MTRIILPVVMLLSLVASPLATAQTGEWRAYSADAGEIRWRVPNGDGLRDHPASRRLNLPPIGQAGRVSPRVTATALFLGERVDRGMVLQPEGVGGKVLRAYDKRTGAVVAEIELPGGTSAAPISWRYRNGLL